MPRSPLHPALRRVRQRSSWSTVTVALGSRAPCSVACIVTSSPDWIARRLTAAGMRSINNVVDVSNYVMLELNQPNHAYDLDALGGDGFRVRRAREGETMVTLDGVERAFTADDLLICDANDVPIGIGGIMGGLDSEINDTHHHDRPRDRLVRADRHRQDRRPTRPAQRGVAALRSRRRSTWHAVGARPLRRAAATDMPRPRRP